MSIGHHTEWIILGVSPNGVPKATAELMPNDKRLAMKFRTATDAYAYIDRHCPDNDLYMYFPIEVKA